MSNIILKLQIFKEDDNYIYYEAVDKLNLIGTHIIYNNKYYTITKSLIRKGKLSTRVCYQLTSDLTGENIYIILNSNYVSYKYIEEI